MSKASKAKKREAPTPEQIIRARLRRMAGWEEIRSFLTKLVMMAGLMWFLFGYLFGITPVKNNDMQPRLSSGDLLLYYRLEENLRPQDIVVFEKEGKQYIGRVIARNGDSVEITEDSRVKINGSTVVETDIYYSTPKYGDEVEYPVNLTETQYFILCDYRDGARDSRYFGAVEFEEMKGKVLAVIRRSGLERRKGRQKTHWNIIADESLRR